MLTDLLQKVKAFLKTNRKDLLLSAMVFLVGLGSFGLGRLSAIWPEKEAIQIEQAGELSKLSELSSDDNTKLNQLNSLNSLNQPRGNFVASRNGSSYHLLACPGAKQIKEENKVWFQTAEEARRAGYKPAGNCPGL